MPARAEGMAHHANGTVKQRSAHLEAQDSGGRRASAGRLHSGSGQERCKLKARNTMRALD
jgi:hypothetical protein